jgi:hypothetical protein
VGALPSRGLRGGLLGVENREYERIDLWPAVVQFGSLCPGSPSASEGDDLMADESPYIDYENLPAPSEGIIATLFITVRKSPNHAISIRASWAGR